jgi:hypothetical protein
MTQYQLEVVIRRVIYFRISRAAVGDLRIYNFFMSGLSPKTEEWWEFELGPGDR